MRVLWISFLLLGSITCSPLMKYYVQNPKLTGPQQGANVGSGSSSPVFGPGSSNSRGPSVYSGFAPVWASSSGPSGSPGPYYPAPVAFSTGDRVVGPQGVPVSPQNPGASGPALGYGNAYYGGSNEGLSPGAAAGVEPAGAFFRDVTGAEPVYSYQSRSRYIRGRSAWGQSQYIPGDQFPPIYVPFYQKTGPVVDPRVYTTIQFPSKTEIPTPVKGGVKSDILLQRT